LLGFCKQTKNVNKTYVCPTLSSENVAFSWLLNKNNKKDIGKT